MRREDILDLLFNTPWHELRLRAAHVLESEKGFHVHVRGLVEFPATAAATAFTAACGRTTPGCKSIRFSRVRIRRIIPG